MNSPIIRIADGPKEEKAFKDDALSEEVLRNNLESSKGHTSFLKSTSTVQSIERNKHTPLHYNISPYPEEADQMIRESLYFQKISSCLCPSSLPLEIVLFKQTYLPSDQIEVMFLIEKTRKLLK